MGDSVDQEVKWNWWVVIKAVLLSPFDIGFMFVAWALNWYVTKFAVDGQVSDRGVVKLGPVLPEKYRWFQTFDACLDQGIIDGSIPGPSNQKAWTAWLNRNPGYGFSYWFLGIDWVADDWKQIRFQEADFANGIELDYLAMSSKGYFNIHKTFWFLGLHLRIKWGWKAWNMKMVEDPSGWNPKPWGPVFRIPFVFSLSKAD